MNKQTTMGIIIGAVAVTAIGGMAGYQISNSGEYAEVVAVTPVSKTISVPREECRDELVSRKKPVKDTHQITGTLAGAVIGGVLGNQVGGGRGKDIATVGGAVAGGYAGNKIQEDLQDKNVVQEMRQVCSTVYDKHEESDGFEVTYLLDGQQRVVHMEYDPGNKIPMENGQLAIETNS